METLPGAPGPSSPDPFNPADDDAPGIPAWQRFALVLLAAATGLWLLMAYVDQQLAARDYADVYAGCRKVWATRGLVTGAAPSDSTAGNTIESVQRAFRRGAEGSEIDVYFDPAMDRYVVSHDFPYVAQPDGDLLLLETLLAAIPADRYIWLDFKKLRRLTLPEARRAVTRLEAITEGSGTRSRIYVEGADPLNLKLFQRAGFATVFDVHPLPERDGLTRPVLGAYRLVYFLGGFTVMAMKAGDPGNPVYGPVTRKLLEHVPVFVYHVPDDAATLASLLDAVQVRVIIMADHGLDRFAENSCGD